MTNEHQAAIDKGVAILASVETKLHAARHDLAKLENVMKIGRSLDMIDGQECMLLISEIAMCCGAIAKVERNIYTIHGDLTSILIGLGIDPGGPYAVLKNHMPEVETKSGGGRR